MAQRSEEVEQARLIKWTHKRDTRALMPALAWLHHSPNGGRRDGFTGAQMTALGVKKGFPDLILPVKSSGFAGLAIELKSDTGQLRPDQRAWLDMLGAQGWATHVCRSAEAAKEVICTYLLADLAQTPPLD